MTNGDQHDTNEPAVLLRRIELLERELGDYRRREWQLREHEREARLLMDQLPNLVSLLQPGGKPDLINRRILDFTGMTEQELLAWGNTQLVHPDDLPRVEEQFRRGIASEAPFTLVYRMRRHDQTYRWFEGHHEPLKSDDHRVYRWCVCVNDIDELTRARDALRESERDLRLVVATIPGLICLFTPDGRLEDANQPFLDYSGVPVEQADAWATTGLVHPEDTPQIAEAFAYSIRTGEPYDFEARVRRYDGVYRWFQIRGQAHRDEQGRIIRWYGLLTDIDDLKRAESLLAGERQLLEMVASGQALSDVLGALCRVVERLAGDCCCEVRLLDAVEPTIQQSIAPSLSESYTLAVTGTPLRPEVSVCGLAVQRRAQVIIEDLDADPRWRGSAPTRLALAQRLRSVWTTPVFSRHGLVIATLSIYRREPARPSAADQDLIGRAVHLASITIERLRAESELNRRANHLATGERVSLTGSFAWQPDDDRITCSEQFRRIFELEETAQISAEDVRRRVHLDDAALLEKLMAETPGGRDNSEYEIRLQMPEGRLKYVRVSTQLIQDREGSKLCIGAAQDVTRRRQAEEALDKVRSDLTHLSRVLSLGTLTASIAHEVNQPLAGIVTNTTTCVRMLSASPPNVAGALETARRTMRDARRATDVIDRLRALFARRTTRSGSVDLNQAAAEVVSLLASELQRNRVSIRTDWAVGLPLVDADRVQLQQVIVNLMKNACDSMSEVEERQKLLTISTQSTDAGVELSVKDVGVGYPVEDSERMFQAFYTSKSSGMGIGLSVSRRIIESHRGRLWCRLNPDHGATFVFFLPASAAVEPSKR